MNLLPELPKTSSADPLYNIGAVTRMTGISMATLRAWERRYNFPEAERTSGGHRLYSEQDILRLRWVKERIDQGMQTAQAIQALRYQEASREILPAAQPPEPKEPASSLEGTFENTAALFHARLLNALIQGSLAEAETILNEALVSFNPDDLILKIISPTLAGLGKAWEEKRITVAAEHLATNFLRQRLEMWMAAGAQPLSMPPIVLACAPDEWHETGLLMLGAILRRMRYPIAYLGQAVPFPDLASFVASSKPALVVLVAMSEHTASQLSEWPAHMPAAAATGRPIVCYAGRPFVARPDLRRNLPGIYLGDTLEEGLQEIQRRLSGLA